MVLILLLFAASAFGQKKQMVEYRENIVVRAMAELDSLLVDTGGDFFKQLAELNISGQYVFDITLREKGVVATVFVVNDGINPIPMQNSLKDLLKRYRFSFRVPKGKSYKFQYTFNL